MNQVWGASLHFYNEKMNSDKFYRVFSYWEGAGATVVQHWGRDGTVGQMKVTRLNSTTEAETLAKKILSSKIQDGYTPLGSGTFWTFSVADKRALSDRVRDWVGTSMLKIPHGFTYVIREEECVEDLIA